MITKNKAVQTTALILIAFVFSMAVRMIWVYKFNDVAQYKHNDSFMLTTTDGYYFAEGAKDIIENNDQLEAKIYNSPIRQGLSLLTAILYKISPWALDDITFYMPAFFSSLIVVPLVLIGFTYGSLSFGFIAALIGSIAWSYYNRTMVGYYDTDLLNIVFPTFLLWSLIGAIVTKHDRYILLVAIETIVYRWWYPQSYSLEVAFIGLLVVYAIYTWFRKRDNFYNLVLIAFMILSTLNIDTAYRASLVAVLLLFLHFKKDVFRKYVYYILGFAVALFFATGGLEPIINMLKGYLFQRDVIVTQDVLKLHFYAVMQTISEAKHIPFETFANRISGHTITFFLSIVGFLWLVLNKKSAIVALPMIGLGFIALSGGLRFTVYAVPVFALGIAYLIVQVSNMVEDGKIKAFIMIMLTVLVLTPNIIHAYKYDVQTVFMKDEVKVLKDLEKIVSSDDYLVGWWDYGYPTRYYANTHSFIDGAMHNGSANFPTSYFLTKPQEVSAKMLRLETQYIEKGKDKFRDTLNGKKVETNKTHGSTIAHMTFDYGFNDTNDFLYSLSTDIKLPKKTKEVYLYLPQRMLNIYPVIERFSNIDLMTGTKGGSGFFYYPAGFSQNDTTINFGSGIILNKTTGVIDTNSNIKYSVKRFITTNYTNNSNMTKDIKLINNSGNINIIYMKNQNRFLLIDDDKYNSTYMQLFIMDNYDKNLFDLVIYHPLVKIYKLKL